MNQKPLNASLKSKKCSKCGASHFLNYAELENNRRPLQIQSQSRFIAFSTETIFERKIIDMMTGDLLFKHSTFQAFSSAFNYMTNTSSYISSFIPEGKELVEKRLIEYWFLYKALMFCQEYFGGLEGISLPFLMDLDNF